MAAEKVVLGAMRVWCNSEEGGREEGIGMLKRALRRVWLSFAMVLGAFAVMVW